MTTSTGVRAGSSTGRGRPITFSDIRSPREYEFIREEFQRRIIDLKSRRRIAVGEIVSIVFESRDTVLFQIQEMVRAEGLVAPDAVQAEIDVYRELLPDDAHLSATLLIEIPNLEELKSWLPRLPNIERHVGFRIGGEIVRADCEEGRSREDYTASIHYIKFPLSGARRAAFGDPGIEVALFIDHPNYTRETALSPTVRAELLAERSIAP